MNAFDNSGDPLPHADAHGREAIATAAFFHLVNECRHDSRAAAAEGVTEGNGATVNVELRGIDAELSNASNNLGSKGLVQFHQIDLVDGQTGSLQGLLGSRNRPNPHVIRVNPGGSRGDDPNHRLQFKLLGLLRSSQQESRRAIGKGRGVSSRHRPIFFEGGLQRSELLKRSVRSWPFVFVSDEG